MLFIVLILVLGALGLLVTALITAQSLWAWVSIGVSALAGLLLLADFLRRRRKRPAGSALGAAVLQPVTPAEPAGDATEPDKSTEFVSENDQLEVGSDGDPAEEKSAPADIEVVSELDAEVVVVDEYPRYHLTGCGWLTGRETIPITVKEARNLGFTPCARCAPDSHLAAAHRTSA
ncbi:MAG TPA: hypothetical protein VJT49_09165 [Amycolatopsis sp.]|uniref:hypothetical protein n=1 Tax=Amycolatopsis sp. TaxID=37632 RepID=UPI002B49242D|nr:hypothetical protein [Amycolatopsis sp.]HKS45270.1 hypothetical protein [Amycolatopsis sp.]